MLPHNSFSAFKTTTIPKRYRHQHLLSRYLSPFTSLDDCLVDGRACIDSGGLRDTHDDNVAPHFRGVILTSNSTFTPPLTITALAYEPGMATLASSQFIATHISL